MITDAGVAAAHPDLPGLGLLLDPARLPEALRAEGMGDYRLDRLRIKPGASVTAMLRPVAGVRPWLLARGLAPEPWETKRHKDLRGAARAGLPGWEWPEDRLVLVAAAADRRIPGLAGLHPDSGPSEITWPAHPVRACRKERPVADGPLADPVGICATWPHGAKATSGATVRTLSHNPARRWVGIVEIEGERSVLRLHRDRAPQVLPWQPGRTWSPGDPVPVGGNGAAHIGGTAPTAGPPGGSGSPVDVPSRLRAAVRGLRMLHGSWGDRAAAVVDRVSEPLARVACAPAHGDLTPDQVVTDGQGHLGILDWDEAGWWPAGWDAATWTAGLIVAGWHPGDGTAAVGTARPVDAAVLAAAAVLRGPEPFRRRHPDWAHLTKRLLGHAEQALTEKHVCTEKAVS